MRVLAGQRSACRPRDYFSWVSKSCRHPGKIVPWRGVAALARPSRQSTEGPCRGAARGAPRRGTETPAFYMIMSACVRDTCYELARAANASTRISLGLLILKNPRHSEPGSGAGAHP